MLAFAELFDPGATDPERAAGARRTARKALALAPEHPRASIALAIAEKRLGNAAEARRVLLDALRAHGASDALKSALHWLNSAGA